MTESLQEKLKRLGFSEYNDNTWSIARFPIKKFESIEIYYMGGIGVGELSGFKKELKSDSDFIAVREFINFLKR